MKNRLSEEEIEELCRRVKLMWQNQFAAILNRAFTVEGEYEEST
ncbi:unnamed protein product [marine sediment metagenome]|uniref:Uncharacterized protein n=1 Tax=marine sediment metagenome TaxID=412755 RepID=X0VUX8_9ZZZZ